LTLPCQFGFVFPTPIAGSIRHNSFPHWHLSFLQSMRNLGLFGAEGMGLEGWNDRLLEWYGNPVASLPSLTLDTSNVKLPCPIGFVPHERPAADCEVRRMSLRGAQRRSNLGVPAVGFSRFMIHTSNLKLRGGPVIKTLRAARLFHRNRKEGRNSVPTGSGNRRR